MSFLLTTKKIGVPPNNIAYQNVAWGFRTEKQPPAPFFPVPLSDRNSPSGIHGDFGGVQGTGDAGGQAPHRNCFERKDCLAIEKPIFKSDCVLQIGAKLKPCELG